MDHAINAPGHGNICFGMNNDEKRYLKGKTEVIGKLVSNEASKIGMLPSAPKYFSVKFSDQFIHISPIMTG